MLLKICGLTCENDVDIINAAPPDYAGFVFAESKRRVTPGQAKNLIEKLSPTIKSVGVFVNETTENMAKIAKYCGLAIVQLHGDVAEGQVREAAALLPEAKIIKCVRTRDKASVLSAIDTAADFLLFDTYDKKNAGGTGKRADWELLLKTSIRDKITKPFFIAGGINAQNIQEAAALNPYAIDVSSGAEGPNGHKDAEKVKALMQAVRN